MVKKDNLLEALFPTGTSVEDVLCVMDGFFSSVRGQNDHIIYSRDERCCDLILKYEHGKVASVTAGESLDEVTLNDLWHRIQAEAVESPDGSRIGRKYLFSELPVDGYWRFEDCFQILPAPEGAPKPPSVIAPHPFLLEFRVRSSTNSLLEVHRRQRETQRIVNLLNAMCNCRIWTFSPRLQFRWVNVRDTMNPIQCVTEEYRVPGETVEQSNWSSLDSIALLKRANPDNQYYSPLHHVGTTLLLPADAEEYATAAAELTGERLDRFRRSTYWLRYAEEARHISESAAYVALVTAIECLQPLPEKGAVCEKCGLRLGAGPTKQFTEFLGQYLPPTAELRSTKRDLYSLRSNLAHGWGVFQADLDLLSSLHPDGFTQWISSLDMEKIVRWVIRNWLLQKTAE